jgi:hypothetical protein
MNTMLGNYNQTVLAANVIDLRIVDVTINFHTFDID